MAEKNFDNSDALEGMNLEPDSTEHELVVDNSKEDDYYNVDNQEKQASSDEQNISPDNLENDKDATDYTTDDDLPEKSIQKKRTKLQKILTLILSVLLVLLTIGVILYFIGFFDKEEEKPAPKPIIEQKVEQKVIEFKSRDINTQRLNKKLNNLTKYDDAIIKKKKEEEAKKKAEEEAKRKAEEEAKRKAEFEAEQKKIEEQKKLLEKEQQELEVQKQELVTMKEKLLSEVEEKKAQISQLVQEKQSLESPENNNTEDINKNKIDDKSQVMAITEEVKNNGNSFLSFINVAVLKNSLTKSFLKKVEKIDTNIYLCRDNKNQIEIYVGPYEMSTHRSEKLNKFIDAGFKEAMLIDLTQEEFNKRCKY